MTEESRPPERRRVARGEGEVTAWPRGLLDYVSYGEEEGIPSAEEDRTRNRLALTARLLGLLRARGENVEAQLVQLRAAEQAYVAKDRAEATELVERLLGELDGRIRAVERPTRDK